MSTDIQSESARIYAFPARARNSGTRLNEQPGSVVELAVRRLPRVEFGSWYHEAAIAEAQQESKR